MRTRLQHNFAYNGLTPAEFAERTSQSAGQVRQLIAARWFKAEGDVPELLDVASIGAKQPTWKIHPSAVDRFLKERSEPRIYPKIERKRKAS